MTRKDLQAEAQARWGDTPEWRAAAARIEARGPAELAALKAEQKAVLTALVDRMTGGLSPADRAVQAEVERWRRFIERWFYPCDDAQLARLATLYESDARFRATFEDMASGLANFVIAAFRHGRQEVRP